ncbi:hypothetical protein ACO0SA_001498 [Hanseniaspora valbyensis]
MELYLNVSNTSSSSSSSNDPRTYILRDPKDNTTLHIQPEGTKKGKNTSVKLEIHGHTKIASNPNYTQISNSIKGFVGLISLENDIFLCLIKNSQKIAQPTPNESIEVISKVRFYCITNSRYDFMDLRQYNSSSGDGYDDSYNDEYDIPGGGASSNNINNVNGDGKHPCADLQKLLENGSFYFSNDFDLTCTLQKRGVTSETSKYVFKMESVEKEYMWNSFLMEDFLEYYDNLSDLSEKQMLNKYITVVIRGFAKTEMSYVANLRISETIVSKQSWKRAGTRFLSRGMDDDGNVANFVETEFTMYSKEFCYSFAIIRGSVPCFWEQDTALLNPKVTVNRSVEATQPVFDSHFGKVCSKYGPVNIVNLLSTKSSEIELTKRYRSLYKGSKLGNELEMTEFDFHKETSQDGFAAASKISPMINDFLMESGYFAYDVRDKKLISEQNGVFRVNCLDCLDRTNLIQQLISNMVFKLFLLDFKLLDRNLLRKYEMDMALNLSTGNGGSNGALDSAYVAENCFSKHNSIWADNGDQISQIYTGTNALKSSFTRKGKMSFAGALSDATKSVSRMYINNFMDKGKQSNIDKLLGKLPDQEPVSIVDPQREYIKQKLNEFKSEYVTSENVNILIGTYNCNNISAPHVDLKPWLFPIGDKFKPDMVVLGLQEVIELSAGSILNADYSKLKYWETLVFNCLNQYDDYVMLRTEQMSSLMVIFFVKKSLSEKVKQVEGSSKKTGFGGITGNKGGVAIRFEFGSTSFAFVNSHLAAGQQQVYERCVDFDNIYDNIKFSRGRTLAMHDNIFWLGDLNFRLNLPNESVRKVLQTCETGDDYQKLLQYDQLNEQVNFKKTIFKGFYEPTIKFPPTYKYNVGTDLYDTSEKARTPSWCDRILYKGEDIRPLSYSDAVLRFSDHKPVYAAYRVKVDFVDEAKKQKIINEHKQPGLGEEPSLLEIAESINSNDSKSNKGNRPAPPPVPSKRNIDNITVMQTPEPSSATIVDVTTNRPPPPLPPPIRKATTLPPGFDHGMTLKPRNASSTSISIDTSKNVPSFDEFKEEHTVSSSISEKSGTPKLSNWQPLTPK